MLGESLAARGIVPDLLISGGMRRHAQTLEGITSAASWSREIEVDERWAEYDHMAIIAAHKPAYRSMTLMQADLVRTFQPRKAFQTMFDAALVRWTGGEHDDSYSESFVDFQKRVEGALGGLVERLEAGQTALVVTSGGAMSWAAAHLLKSGTATWRELHHVTVNTGVTRVVHGQTGTSVVAINEHGHLDAERDLITVR